VSIEIPNRMDDLPSYRAGIPGGRGHDASSAGDLSRTASALDDDAQREMQRAPCTDERPRQLQVRSRVDEHPRVLVTEPEAPKLLETPRHHALILERELVGGWWELSWRHTFYNDRSS